VRAPAVSVAEEKVVGLVINGDAVVATVDDRVFNQGVLRLDVEAVGVEGVRRRVVGDAVNEGADRV
jgi:hypothetical protein